MDKIGGKRRREMKRGRVATEAVAATSEGVQKLLTRYKRVTEARPSNYVLISVGGKFGEYKNGGDGGVLTAAGATEGPLRIRGTT